MFGIPFLSPTLLGAIGLTIVAGLGGAWTAHRLDAGPLAQAQAETVSAKASLTAYEASVMASVAKANADALNQQKALSDHANALQQQLLDQQKANDAKTKSLQALLAAAKPGQIVALGPVSLAYYQRLRDGAAASPATAPGNP